MVKPSKLLVLALASVALPFALTSKNKMSSSIRSKLAELKNLDPVVREAIYELQAWEGKTETDPEMLPLLKAYWATVGGYPGDTTTPWSGAFISWVTRVSAPGALVPNASHVGYAASGLKAGPGQFLTIRPDVAVKPGDILIKGRAGSSPKFEDLGKGHVPSHGDIVVLIDGDRAWVVGGNVRNSVELSSYKLRTDGQLMPGQGVFAMMRRKPLTSPGPATIERPSEHPKIAHLPEYRRALQREVTREMSEAAKLALSSPLGTTIYYPAFAVAVESHRRTNSAPWHKGASIFLPLGPEDTRPDA